MSSSHFSSEIVEVRNASALENHLSRERLAFRGWGDFHARSRFADSTIPEEKWVLLVVSEAATTKTFQEKPLEQGYHLHVSLMISAVIHYVP